jgi:hypothetical protein
MLTLNMLGKHSISEIDPGLMIVILNSISPPCLILKSNLSNFMEKTHLL